jgi:gamma-glutamyl-gamma-aminobutyrate hydrolase PuuD
MGGKRKESARKTRAKAKREKIGIVSSIPANVIEEQLGTAEVEQRLEESYNRTWSRRDDGTMVYREGNKVMGVMGEVKDTGWIERSYPSERTLEEADFLTAEEALAQEEQLLGKRGVPDGSLLSPLRTAPDGRQVAFDYELEEAVRQLDEEELNDDMPDFLHTAAKAGPPPPVHASTCPLLAAVGNKCNCHMSIRTPPAILMPSNDDKPKRHVTLVRDHDLEYPDLYMAIHILPDPHVRDDCARFAKMFARSGCYQSRKGIEGADLVVFGGGSDVDPSLYDETKHPMTFFSRERDDEDMEAYVRCRELGIPMLGICRGAQFLHVMNGGKLYQDIDNHQGPHAAHALREQLRIDKISSVHHQACAFNKGMEVLMTSQQSKTRWKNADEKEEGLKPDIEAFFYRDTGCFGVQGHPEYAGYNRFTTWVLESVQNLFLNSPDYSWEKSGGRLRMTTTARDAQKIAADYVENAYSNSKEA